MELDTLYIVLAIPCLMGFYIVYELIKMGSERKR